MLISAIATMTVLSGAFQRTPVRIQTEGFGPSGEIAVAFPKVAWKIWPEGESKVTSIRMTLNSHSIACKYDVSRRELVAEGITQLMPGTYKVEAGVMIDGWAKFDEKWQFVISPDSMDLPTYSAEEKSAVNVLNEIREKHQLPHMALDPYLTMTARSHTNYLSVNDLVAHEQQPELPGFSGVGPADRGKRFGHVGGIWEVVSGGADAAEDAIISLWNAPYHRIVLMQSGKSLVGVGWHKGHFTMNGSPSWDKGVYMSPYAGQEGVPIAWANQEVPNPTRNYPDARFLLGYPIVIVGSETQGGTLNLVDVTLTDSKGTVVKTYVQHRKSDEFLTNAVIIIPTLPLKFGETYTVDANVTISGDTVVNRKWSFATQADNKRL